MFEAKKKSKPEPAKKEQAPKTPSTDPASASHGEQVLFQFFTGKPGAGATNASAADDAARPNNRGQAAEPGVREAVERVTGTPIPDARVHSDADSNDAASALDARAFTYGQNIFLGPGESASDTRVMAHELTHVAQQSGGTPELRRLGDGEADTGEAEQQAEQVATEIQNAGEEVGAQAIVEDDAQAGPGQMTRSEFLAQLRSAVTATASDVLGPLWPGACPYIENWFSRHSSDDASSLDRMARRYTGLGPESGASSYVEAIAERLREAIIQWSRGEATVSSLVEAAEPEAAQQTPVQAMSLQPGQQSPKAPSQALGGLGDGRPLDTSVMGRLGGALGQPLSDVRVHTDAAAAKLANQVDALAFTFGSHVAFGEGSYRPGTVAGDLLLAHELAHVAQQREGPVGGRSGINEDVAEADADQAARRAAEALYGKGEATSRSLRFMPLRLQRCSRKSAEQRSVPERTPPSPRPGTKTLTNGRMEWNLRPAGSSSAEMDVYFYPNDAVRARANTVTFIQTVVFTVDGQRVTGADPTGDFGGGPNYAEPTTGARVDFILNAGGGMSEDFEPFYGAAWDDAARHWTQESSRNSPWLRPATPTPAPSPSTTPAPRTTPSTTPTTRPSTTPSTQPTTTPSTAPSSEAGVTPAAPAGGTAAHLYDNPQFNIAQGEAKTFETVAVIPETGEVLGSLRWGFAYTRENGRQFSGATQADCVDAATPAYQGALERYYTQRYTTLDDFDPNDATLKPAHNTALTGFIASQRSGTAPIRVQGFAELSETDPSGISRRRAQAVSDYLTANGIASSRVTIEAYGGQWARVATATAGAGTRNRRVQIVVSGR